MDTDKTLYKVQYYEYDESKTLNHTRRSALVFADDPEKALVHVEHNTEDFDGFPWDHESARTIIERDVQEAESIPGVEHDYPEKATFWVSDDE